MKHSDDISGAMDPLEANYRAQQHEIDAGTARRGVTVEITQAQLEALRAQVIQEWLKGNDDEASKLWKQIGTMLPQATESKDKI